MTWGWSTKFAFRRNNGISIGLGIALLALLSGCQATPTAPPARHVVLQQQWELDRGDRVAGYLVSAGLGDVSIELGGDSVHAPFDGEVAPAAGQPSCVYFSSSDVPAYLFRFCGLRRPHLGTVRYGDTMGSGEILHFATLRRHPDGTWAIVEPSNNILERSLQPPLQSARP
ncbi:hypothetical protein XM38_041030 [Halomicronema hongdechloris C2206]|uniref:Uncharacterized protein n=1 Tax=Halomicronema hongdechloris C2206 TaxID=1641165 RepID=A0A1Z3HS53_9CYAN|nr:hypothetical protein [Halomicronema hongdechloris]ASC73141.1 hypothetical protein XM38_041030 [Halomicronema hongdechloris C2206]